MSYIPTTKEERKVETAHVHFYLEPQIDPEKTLAEGKNVYRDVEWCTITPAGANPKTVINREVDESIKRRFAAQYQAFKENREAEVEGTDLRNWPIITPAQVQTCRSLRIFSVEQLAETDEATIKVLGQGGYILKKNAADWTNAANEGAGKLVKQIEALTQERDDLKSKLAMRDEEISELKVIVKMLEGKANAQQS